MKINNSELYGMGRSNNSFFHYTLKEVIKSMDLILLIQDGMARESLLDTFNSG